MKSAAGRRARGGGVLVLLLGLVFGVAGCGYRPGYAGAAAESFHVVLARAAVAEAVAADEVASGVREELAREGALAGGSGYPRVEIEVTRVDEASEGVAAAGPAGEAVPVARATEVGLVARAWLVRAPGGEKTRDTGDVRVLVVVGAATALPGSGALATTSPASIDSFHHEDGVRAAGRRAGIRLARRILGEPAPGNESSGF